MVRAAPGEVQPYQMRAMVLCGHAAWEAGPRSASEFKEAATHYDRAAALHPAPAVKTTFADQAARSRSQADSM